MSLAYNDRGSIIIDFLAIRASDTDYERATAYECILQYCVKTIEASQFGGELIEIETNVWTNNSESARTYLDSISAASPLNDIEDPTSVPTEQYPEYILRPTEVCSLFLQGTVTYKYLDLGGVYSNDQIQGTDSSLKQSETGLSELMDNVAKAMTVALRTNSGATFEGSIHANEPYIHIRWAWIALPCTIYLLAVVFLALVVTSGRNGSYPAQVWKNSGVSAMLHGLDSEQLRRRLGALDDQDDIDRVAENLVVRLVSGENGLYFEVRKDGQYQDDE